MVFFSALEKFDIICFLPIDLFGIIDLSLTNIYIYMLFSLLVILCFFLVNSYNALIPALNRVFFFSVSSFIFEQVDKQIGYKGFVFYPFFLLLFLFILICNLLGLVPFSFSPTAHIVFSLFFSMVI